MIKKYSEGQVGSILDPDEKQEDELKKKLNNAKDAAKEAAKEAVIKEADQKIKKTTNDDSSLPFWIKNA